MSRQAILAAICLLFAIRIEATVTVTDDSGREIRLPRPAERIVSLAPHLTELLFAAGAGDRITGAARYSDYPHAAADIVRIGDAHNFDLEHIVALQPDLVVAWQSGNPPAQVQRLQESGLTVYRSEPRQLKDIATTIEELGVLAGTPRQAEKTAAGFRQRLAGLRTEYAGRPTLTVFYQVWHDPLITIGGNHVINDVIRLCGGRNIFADVGQLAPRVGTEAVLAAAPEVIVASGSGNQRPDWFDNWRRWPELPAVSHDRLYFIPPALIQRHTPRLLEGARRLCEILEKVRSNTQSGR